MNQRVIALGMFDGVHIGHGALLSRAVERAEACGARASALTFTVPPAQVLRGDPISLINTPKERAALMKKLYRIQDVLVFPFDADFAAVSWEEFLTRYLLEQYHACHFVVGYDFRFGAGGEGTASRLQEFCAARGLGCDVIDQVSLDGVKVSSSHIRDLIARGEFPSASRFLGHPHYMELAVSSGKQLGRTIGAPTINQIPKPGTLLPPFGVYATRVWVEGGSYRGVTNVGVRPSVSDGGAVSVETHILDYSGNLYETTVALEFLLKLRDEQKFPSVDALQAQILSDIAFVREMKKA